MTSKIEQKFYDTFEIEPLSNWHKCKDYGCTSCNEYEICSSREFIYPDITAEKLLQLLCIVINEYNINGHTFYLDSTNVEELKEEILDALMGCIDASCDLFEIQVNQIKQLFKD